MSCDWRMRGWTRAAAALLWLIGARPAAADPTPLLHLNSIFDGPVRAVARIGDTLYVGGEFSGVAPSANVLPPIWTVSAATGALVPPGFPSFDGDVLTVEPDGAGGFYVGGRFLHVGTVAQPYLAHLFADGSLDPFFRPSVDGSVQLLARLGTRLFMHGAFLAVGGVQSFSWGAVDAASGVRVAWRPEFNAASTIVPRVMLAADDRLVIGGTDALPMAASGLVAAYAADTGAELWRAGVTPGGVRLPRGTVAAMARVGSRLIVAHTMSTTNGQRGLSRLDVASGAIDPAWSVTGVEPRSLAVADGAVYFGGTFTSVAGQPRQDAAAVDLGTAALLPWSPAAAGVDVLAPSGAGGVVVMAAVDSTPFLRQRRLARVDAGGGIVPWTVDPRPPSVTAVLPGPSGTFVVLGGLAGSGTVARRGLAAFDVSTGALLPWAPQADGPVTVLGASGNRVIAGGLFTAIDGIAASGVVSLHAATGAVEAAPSGSGPAAFVDERWFYRAATVSGGIALQRAELATGALDPSWQGPTVATAPVAAAYDATTLYVASSVGITALDRATARLKWHRGGSAGAVAVSGDTVFAELDVSPAGPVLMTLDAHTGTPIRSIPGMAIDGLAVADGRLLLAGTVYASQTSDSIYALTLDSAQVRWTSAVSATLTPLGFFAPRHPTFHVSDGLLVVGGVFGTRSAPALQGMAVYGLDGGRAPAALTARPRGAVTEFSWTPAAVPPVNGYVIEAGVTPGETAVTTPVGTATSWSAVVPPGRFHVRVRTASDEHSNEIAVSGGCVAPPPAPRGLAVSLYGPQRDRATLSWTPPATRVTGQTLVIAVAPGVDVLSIALSGDASSLNYASVIPPGRYDVRVRASNECGDGIFTPRLRVTVGAGVAAPPAPARPTVMATASGLAVAWTAPGGPVTGYLLEAGSEAGLADLAVVPLGVTPGVVLSGVPAGVYVIRVRAVNDAGTGRASDDAVVRVPVVGGPQ